MAGLLRTSLQSLRRLNTLTTKEMTIRRGLATTPRYNSEGNTQGTQGTNKKRKWVSYGFDKTDEALDRHSMHQIFFVAITLVMVLGGTIMAYAPDPAGKDWSQREAYLRLRYREENGLPLIDPNLIDPAKITLPSDEELGDTEIII
ncbi:NADH dehydrogenase [ubiquinone] 1 beta subcomplex subunit 11, mitochondrial [Pseudomyrmex gracilis]|uniref:NADH dehydrogenase [ubiquinone] 1 beta subcomplex subunit 11, mitochondrial n=1 Tax=Pseudomyrmex gracilis TaxID=219809 RepID=UPI000994F310|nr:NADH dehydrogenase [ubiquinone] 1 beta subcomplex subunit 11, mitochondrial [Pseudomyrmex gracilis]